MHAFSAYAWRQRARLPAAQGQAVCTAMPSVFDTQAYPPHVWRVLFVVMCAVALLMPHLIDLVRFQLTGSYTKSGEPSSSEL